MPEMFRAEVQTDMTKPILGNFEVRHFLCESQITKFYSRLLKSKHNYTICYTIQLMHYSHFKTQSLQHLKTNKMLKTCFVRIKPLHVSVFFHDHLQGVLRCASCRYYSSR